MNQFVVEGFYLFHLLLDFLEDFIYLDVLRFDVIDKIIYWTHHFHFFTKRNLNLDLRASLNIDDL